MMDNQDRYALFDALDLAALRAEENGIHVRAGQFRALASKLAQAPIVTGLAGDNLTMAIVALTVAEGHEIKAGNMVSAIAYVDLAERLDGASAPRDRVDA